MRRDFHMEFSESRWHGSRRALVAAVLSILLLPFAAESKGAPAPDRWEAVIQAFETSDNASPPPKNALLLVGGSNARRWTDVADYFPGEKIINRGFGGAQLADVLHYVDRIVTPYAPRIIFLNAGGNDLAAGTTPEQVRDACKAFVEKVWAALPQTRIYYVSIPPVLRASKEPERMVVIRHTNALIEELTRGDARLGFVDLFPRFLDDKGQSKPELFVSDGTHFSPKGHELAAKLMREKAGLHD